MTKSGSNQDYGPAFWFHNDNHQNSCSNLDKAGKPGGFCTPTATGAKKGSPFRLENQIGGTLGGPMLLPRFGEGGPSIYDGKDKSWFFASVQRWTDRRPGGEQRVHGFASGATRRTESFEIDPDDCGRRFPRAGLRSIQPGIAT